MFCKERNKVLNYEYLEPGIVYDSVEVRMVEGEQWLGLIQLNSILKNIWFIENAGVYIFQRTSALPYVFFA